MTYDAPCDVLDIEPGTYEDDFLISELLTSRMTVLAAEPKAGKSLLATAMVTALVRGASTFLGFPVHRQLSKVLFLLTDDGAARELRSRVPDDIPRMSILVQEIHNNGDPEYWSALPEQLEELGVDLLVVDNMLGALAPGEDIANSSTAQSFVNNMKPILERDIPVLAITHTPKGAGEGLTVASAPIGGRAIAAGSRGVLVLRKSKDGRRLQTAINGAHQDRDIPVSVRRAGDGTSVPLWSVVEKKQANTNDDKASDKGLCELAARIIEEQPEESSMSALGRRYAAETGLSDQAIRKGLTKLIKRDGERWVALTV